MTAAAQRASVFAGCAALAAAILVGAYSNFFDNEFHFDDSHVVESNLYIRALNIPAFFRDASTGTSNPSNAVYRPLVTTTLALDYALGGGLNARQFHRSQLVMLLLLAVMVFLVFLRLLDLTDEQWWNRYAALLATLVVALHTTTTETMNLIHARSELLSAMGVAGSFLVYFHAPRSRPFLLYLLPMILGALAKSPAVMFAPLFLVYVYLFEQKLSLPDLCRVRTWPRVRAAVVKSAPAFVAGVITFLVVSRMDAPTVNYSDVGRLDYLRTQPFVWLHYARLFFLPVGLTADTDWSVIPHWYDTRVIAGLVFVAFLVRVLWRASTVQVLRPVTFGVAWFVVALVPSSSVVPLAEVANEHRVFFPYIGLSLAVVWGAAQAIARWADAMPRFRPTLVRGALALALVAAAGNAVGTYERNKTWRSGETLWRDVAEKSPANGRGLMNYGLTFMARGQFAEAKALFDRALVYTPNYATLEINLGIVTDRLGQKDVAAAHFTRALQLTPNDPAPHFYYGRWLMEQGQAAQAIPSLRRAVELSPSDTDARHLLLDGYARTGQTTELMALAADTLRLAPGDARATRYRAGGGTVAPAPRLEATPAGETAESLLTQSLYLYRARDFQGSVDAARRALQLRPGYAEAHNNVAAGLAALGQWDDAIAAAREALRLKPDFPLARNNLVWAETEREKARK